MFLNGNPHEGVAIPQNSGTHKLAILKLPQIRVISLVSKKNAP